MGKNRTCQKCLVKHNRSKFEVRYTPYGRAVIDPVCHVCHKYEELIKKIYEKRSAVISIMYTFTHVYNQKPLCVIYESEDELNIYKLQYIENYY
jgi:hypothetical protein